MFSRTAKSIVKSLGSRQFHIGEKNLKNGLIGGAGANGRSLSHLLRNSAKLNILALHDVTAVNKPLSTYNKTCNLRNDQLFESISSRKSAKTSRSSEISSNVATNNARKADDSVVSNFSNQQDNGKNETEKLVEALYRLPIAEEIPALNSPLMSSEMASKAGNVCSRMRPYARLLDEADPNSVKVWREDRATAAIRKWFLDSTRCPPFQEHDANFIPRARTSSKDRAIKKKRRIKNSAFRGSSVAKEDNRRSWLAKSLSIEDKKPTRKLTETFRHVQICCRAVEKWTNWAIPATLSNVKLKLCELHSRGRRRMSSFCVKALVGATNDSNLADRDSSNFMDRKREDGRATITRNRDDNSTITDDIVEEGNWIQRTSFKVKSMLPDMRAKIRSRSAIASNPYRSTNAFATNEAISVSNALPDSMVLFASRDTKSRIRSKIEELCTQRKKNMRKKADKDDICKKKKERSCRMEKKCQKREKICQRDKVDCSESRKRTCEKRETVCSESGGSTCRKKDTRDCRKTREDKLREQLCKPQYKDADTCRTKENPCESRRAEQRRSSCEEARDEDQLRSRLCKTPCGKDRKPSCGKRDEGERCMKDKKCGRDTDEDKEETMRRKCEGKKKKMTCTEERKKVEESKKSDCSEIKKIDPCKKKECPTVTKAPGCTESDGMKDEMGKNCRKYSTYETYRGRETMSFSKDS